MDLERQRLVIWLLIFSLVVLSGNLAAKEKKGIKLKIRKLNEQKIRGELISVHRDSLKLFNAENNADITVLMKDVKTITLVKKSWAYQLGVIGTLIGVFSGSARHETYRQDNYNQEYYTWGFIGAGTGIVVGSLLGINRRIKLQGKSEMEIQEVLEHLSTKAREPGIQ